jgi:predicted O-methyltransferase YrrM
MAMPVGRLGGPGCLARCDSWEDAQRAAPPGAGLAGWVSVQERELYFQLAKRMQPGQLFVEIGVYGGTNEALIGLTAPAGVQIVAIDPFINDTHERGQRDRGVPESEIETLQALFRKNVAAAGLSDIVELIVEDSHSVGPRWTRPIDWLIVDGDHTYAGCMRDLNDFAPWVKSGGLLIVDDFHEWDTVGVATKQWLVREPAGRWKREYEFFPPDGSIIGLRRA